MRNVWSKMPTGWIAEGALRSFSEGAAGDQAAALKLYMAIAMFATFKAGPRVPAAGSAQISFSQLEALCDISRRYVARGLAALKAHELIAVDKVGKAHRYRLARYDDAGWGKLPRGHLLQNRRFSGLGIRGTLYLNALKLYLSLVTFRPNDTPQVLLSYDKIEGYTGMTRSSIRRAIDVLVNHEWLSLAAHARTDAAHKPTNVYILRGDFWGRRHQNYVRASSPERAPPTDSHSSPQAISRP